MRLLCRNHSKTGCEGVLGVIRAPSSRPSPPVGEKETRTKMQAFPIFSTKHHAVYYKEMRIGVGFGAVK